MQIKVKCPNKACGKTLLVDADMAGKKGKCSTCETVFLIPGTPNPAKAPGGSTINLDASKSGELSAERKKASAAGRQKSKRRSGDQVPARKTRKASSDPAVREVDYVDYEDYDAPRARSRRRDVYEDYEDYDDYEVDDYYYQSPYDEPYGAPIRQSRARRRSGPNVPLIRAGLLILAIAAFVFCGSIAFKILVELIAMLSSFDVGETSVTIWKIAETLWFGAAIAVIVGYSFLLCFPNRHSSMGLTIAAISVGAVNIIVQLVFKLIPLYSDGRGLLGIGPTSFGSRSSIVVETLMKIGLMEGLFIAEMILVALTLVAMNKQLRDRYNAQSAKRMIIPAGIYGGILLVIGMFVLILSESEITSPTAAKIWLWVLYLFRVGGLGMLIWYFISYILMMFSTRSLLLKA